MRLAPALAGLIIIATALWSGCAELPDDRLRPVQLSPAARSTLQIWIAADPGRRAARAIAPTGSMAPTLNERFIVIVERRPFSELQVGDIIGEYYFDEVIAHRIVGKRSHGAFATKGDALSYVDLPSLTGTNYNGEVVIAAIDRRSGEVRLMSRLPRHWHVAQAAGTKPSAGS